MFNFIINIVILKNSYHLRRSFLHQQHFILLKLTFVNDNKLHLRVCKEELRHIIQKMYGIVQVQGKIQTYILIVSWTHLVCSAKSLLCTLIARHSEMHLHCVLDACLGLGWISHTSITDILALCAWSLLALQTFIASSKEEILYAYH